MNWNAERIRAFREELGMSQAEFADLLGVDARSVRRWEAGQGLPVGAPLAVLNGLYQAVQAEKRKGKLDPLLALIAGAAAMGGLAFLLFSLLTRTAEDNDDDA